jgi:FAD:protein FMN transferase
VAVLDDAVVAIENARKRWKTRHSHVVIKVIANICMSNKAIVLCVAMLLCGCNRVPQARVLSGPTMGTTYTVRWLEEDQSPNAFALRGEVEGELARVDEQMSRYRDDSQLSRFNALRATTAQVIAPEFAELLSEATATVAPLVDAWGFGPRQTQPREPAAAELQALLSRRGGDLVEVTMSPPTLRKRRADVELDVNAIAPGHAVDRIARLLERHGIKNYLIDIGGEIRAQGHNASGEPWRVAIDDPRHAAQVPYATVSLSGGAIATSGGYRHFRVIDGRRYSHLIDPRTGRPASLDIGAVIVIAPTATAADGWATAMFVLGERDGIELATRRGLAVLFLLLDGQGGIRQHASPGFAAYRTAAVP